MPNEWKPNQQKFGAQYKVLGKDYTTPDLYAKVTGKAKYAEDFRAEGMLFCKLLLSPVPHGRVTHLDMRKALAMPRVKAIWAQSSRPTSRAKKLSPWNRCTRANRFCLSRQWTR